MKYLTWIRLSFASAYPVRAGIIIAADGHQRFRGALGGGGDEAAPFIRTDKPRDRVAGLFEAGEIPQVWEVAALLRLHGLHGASVAFEEDALAVGPDFEREAAAVGAQTGVVLDEFRDAQTEVIRQAGDFRFGDTHLAGPPATRRAALAFVKDGHGGKLAGAGGAARRSLRGVGVPRLE